MSLFSRFLPIIVASAGLLLALGGCGGGYGDDGGGSASGQITSVEITPAEATITSDGTQQFTAVASNASGGTVSGSLDWRSSNTGVATIDNGGLATAVAAGTATITARIDTSTQYEGGGIVVSNEALLTVAASAGVTGVAAAPAPIGNALIVLRDQAGNAQTVVTDAAGRFEASVAGMVPPFVLRVTGPSGHSLYSAGVQPGVVNINPVTDLLLRAWYRANGTNADVVFTGRQAPGGPDAKALETLSAALERAFEDTLSGQGLTLTDFSFFSTPYVPGGAGLDRVLAQLRVNVTTSRMAIHDELSDRSAEVIFTADGRAALRVRPAAGRDAAVPLLP